MIILLASRSVPYNHITNPPVYSALLNLYKTQQLQNQNAKDFFVIYFTFSRRLKLGHIYNIIVFFFFGIFC